LWVLKLLLEMVYAVFHFRQRLHNETIADTGKPSKLWVTHCTG
jgi:hypothetical protein